MDAATVELIERMDVFLEGMNEGSIPDQESLNWLAESLAALQLKVHAVNGGYEALAADGFLCAEATCPARETDHRIGDEACGYEMEIRPKK